MPFSSVLGIFFLWQVPYLSHSSRSSSFNLAIRMVGGKAKLAEIYASRTLFFQETAKTEVLRV